MHQADINQLNALYQSQLSGVIYPPETVRGIVFAVCAAPEIPMPENWLIWVFERRGQLASSEQADQLTNVLMTMLQTQLSQMREGQLSLPEHFNLQIDGKGQSAVELFMQGLIIGHNQLHEVWLGCWSEVERSTPQKLEKMQKDLKHCLLMFSTFANVELALEHAKQKGNYKLVDNLQAIFRQLPDALKTYVDLSGQLAGYLPDQFETFQQST